MLRASWWKILAVTLLVYTFIAGMLIPLKSGITNATPSTAEMGQALTLTVTGYNIDFAAAPTSLRAWLKLSEDHLLAATRVEALSDQQVRVAFDLPAYLPPGPDNQAATLIVAGEGFGNAIYPDAVFLRQVQANATAGTTAWTTDRIDELPQAAGISFPFRNILGETIRNTYFHVSLWLSMMIIFIGSVWAAVKYLRTQDIRYDYQSQALTGAGFFFGILGLITGGIWAQYTWGTFWSFDIKQNMTAVALLIYGAYFILRGSLDDAEKRARVASAYNIFAFVALIPLIYVIPRMVDSLHPGSGGNPALGGEDLDSTMRMIFYPAIIGWALFGVWMASLQYRARLLHERLME